MWAQVPTALQSISGWGTGCTSSTKAPITATQQQGKNQLMGSFWSNIANTSTGAKRAAIDKDRMQLLQQLTAARLREYGLGSDDGGKIATAMAAYCGTNGNAINSATNLLSQWNSSGDTT